MMGGMMQQQQQQQQQPMGGMGQQPVRRVVAHPISPVCHSHPDGWQMMGMMGQQQQPQVSGCFPVDSC
jgi:hypothetical protein